jgi:hypothetical protein
MSGSLANDAGQTLLMLTIADFGLDTSLISFAVSVSQQCAKLGNVIVAQIHCYTSRQFYFDAKEIILYVLKKSTP